jgi:hypothetical protein
MKRNKIIFTGIDVNKELCNDALVFWLTYYKPIIVENHTYEFQVSNSGQIGIKIIPEINVNINITNKKLVYFKNGEKLLKNGLFVDTIFDKLIYRSPETFHQTCDYLRYNIYRTIMNYIPLGTPLETSLSTSLLLIGGECYLYSKLIDAKHIDVYSDYESIIKDTLYNNPKACVNLVNYDTITLDNTKNYDFAILNVSKSGLSIRLCNELIKMSTHIKKFIYISCNEKSFKRDHSLLSTAFKLDNRWILKNNVDSFKVGVYLYSGGVPQRGRDPSRRSGFTS